MAAAKAWGILPSQWLALEPIDRALIAAHERNQDRCPGCGTTIGIHPDEYDQIEAQEWGCLICKDIETARKRDEKRKRKPWQHLRFLPRFRPVEEA